MAEVRKRLIRLSDGKVMSPHEEFGIALRALAQASDKDRSDMVQESAKAALKSLSNGQRATVESEREALRAANRHVGVRIATDVVARTAMLVAAEYEQLESRGNHHG